MDSTARDIGEGTQSSSECPVCQETMVLPLLLCDNGHRICNKCRPLLENCRICGGNFHGVRKYNVENKMRLSVGDITPPGTECTCPFSTLPGLQCPWTGKLDDVKKHLLQNHEKKISDKSAKFSMPFTNVMPEASYSLVISTLGEVFMRKAQIKDDSFYLTVMYIGPQKNASKYKYSFTISKKNSVENISICQRTRSFLEDCNDIYRSRYCIKLHYDVVSDFLLESKDLPNVMEISKV